MLLPRLLYQNMAWAAIHAQGQVYSKSLDSRNKRASEALFSCQMDQRQQKLLELVYLEEGTLSDWVNAGLYFQSGSSTGKVSKTHVLMKCDQKWSIH